MKKLIPLLLPSVILSLLGLNCKSDQMNSSVPEHEDENDPQVISDIEGNEYLTIRVGSQLWAIEDLRTTRYNDGTSIPLIMEDSAWNKCSTDAYCSYQHITNPETIRKYGLLYNWHAVNTGKLAPKGWHVPSINEWNIFREYLIANGYNWDETTTGDKVAKATASQTDWKACDTTGTIGNHLSSNNKSGFSALPCGSRYNGGRFGNRGLMNHWWSTTPAFSPRVHSIYLSYNDSSLTDHTSEKTRGFSVRFLKNR